RSVETVCTEAVRKSAAIVPALCDQTIECAKSKNAAAVTSLAVENLSGLEISGDKHGVPTGVDGGVDVGRGALIARGKQFTTRCFEFLCDIADRCAKRLGDGLGFPCDPEDIFCGVV